MVFAWDEASEHTTYLPSLNNSTWKQWDGCQVKDLTSTSGSGTENHRMYSRIYAASNLISCWNLCGAVWHVKSKPTHTRSSMNLHLSGVTHSCNWCINHRTLLKWSGTTDKSMFGSTVQPTVYRDRGGPTYKVVNFLAWLLFETLDWISFSEYLF